MPLSTDLSTSPYFDDYDANKDFYKIMFRPGVSVQARELNQLQTMLQSQIERFGDNIFKRGTIIDGCDITYHSVFPYVKLLDVQTDGAPVNVSSFIDYNVRNSANISPLIASIVTCISGFESQSPNLNTLYLRYINSGRANVGGVSTEQSTFAANQTLTVYDPRNVIEKIISYDDSSGFSNTDSIVVLSSIAVQNSSGGTTFANNFYVGDHISDTVANVQIVAIDTTSNTDVVILRVKPRAIDLKAGNTSLWALSVNTNIQSLNTAPSSVANVVSIVGTGATAILKTGSLGEIDQVTMTNRGSGYYVLPTVSVSSAGATTGQISEANLIAQNFLTQVTVANNLTTPVGTGYAVTVGQGVIYQKGFFARVNEHLVVVDKYANTPDAISIGFDTTEEIINSNQEQSLLDNATGSPNETAPGANRLKLTPKLVTLAKSVADANNDFLSVTEFAAGYPYKQNRQTVYNIIGNEMARRTYEESGNYVLDQFSLNTKSPATLNVEATSFNMVIDPGKAYINGKRVETVAYFETAVPKGTDTITAPEAIISLNYGNYLEVNNVGGTFLFQLGDIVSLRDTAKNYLTTQVGQTPTAAGTEIGTARIRSMTFDSGIPGTTSAVYRLYLFDIQMNPSYTFAQTLSVFYNGANKGVADSVIAGSEGAVIKDNNRSSLVYYAGAQAVKSATNLSYIYRTMANNLTLATNGTITWSVAGGETFPYTGTLSSTQEKDLIILPLANAEYTANLAGTITCNTTSTQVNGTSTTFVTDLQAGDFIKIANSSSNVVAQVNNIVNNTTMFLKANATSTFATANGKVFLPAHVPLDLSRTTRTANVNVSQDQFIVSLGNTVNVATTVAIGYNVKSSNSTPATKVVNRDKFVRLNLSNNATTNTGPWALGVSDVFRLKNVYQGANATFVAGDSGVTDITNNFYIDHNQTEDYYGTSYLYVKPNSEANVSTSDFLLVQFDYFDDSGEGLKAPGASGTYLIDDTKTLANSTTTINTLEIPEMYGLKGDYYDLRDQFDFRPQSANTIAPSSNGALAPVNPTEPATAAKFSNADKKFPAPDSFLEGSIEYYVGRTSRATIDENGQFYVMEGVPGSNSAPDAPTDALTINLLKIPPYPSLPYLLSPDTIAFIDTKIANEKYTTRRLTDYRIGTPVDASKRAELQPKGYTMEDIGNLERRIKDLEYYTSFTLVEALTQKKSIPSSVNKNTDRFKFGFFVDGFDSYNYSDITNPGYRASVVNGVLSPHAEEINLQAELGDQLFFSLPFNETTFISQTQATDGAVVPPPPVVINSGANTGTGTITVPPAGVIDQTPTSGTSTVVTQSIAEVVQEQKTTAKNDDGSVYEDFYFTFSGTTGPARFFINGRDNNMALEVYQRTTPDAGWTQSFTSATADSINGGDISTYGLSGLNGGRSIEHQGSLVRKSYGPAGHWLEDQFKYQWTHNPGLGIYYLLRIFKGQNHGDNGQSGTFGFKLLFPVDSVSVVSAPLALAPPRAIGYNGTIQLMSVPSAIYSWQYPLGYTTFDMSVADPNIQPNNISMYILSDQSIPMTITGLRPNTQHVPTLNGLDVTALCKQIGSLMGAGLVSDGNGTIQLTMYIGSPNSGSQVEKAAYALLMSASPRDFRAISYDGLSTSALAMPVNAYIAQAAASPTVVASSIYGGGGITGKVGRTYRV